MYNVIIDKISNKNICILGFGIEGVSTYKFIRRHLPEKKITIVDKKDITSIEILKNDKNIEIIYGENYLNDLEKYDLIIKSPGISFLGINIENYKSKVTSQLQLLLEVYRENTIGITGTKGKSTTSSLLYKIIKDQGEDVLLLGNIGNPIFDEIENIKKDTYLVIEMASLQLEFVNISPHISLVLNLYEDHLDHCGTLKHYHENKLNLFKYQKETDIGIYSFDNENTNYYVSKNNYISRLFKVTLNNSIDKDTIYLKDNDVVFNNEIIYNKNNPRNLIGEHNLSNIMFCLALSKILNFDMEKVIFSIKDFKSLEHRMELVGTYDGIIYYNDSIATIPMATINAIESLKNVDTLIFGGMDRGIDYSDLVNFLSSSNINNLICMPTTGYKIGKILEQLNLNKRIFFIETLEEAVMKASKITEKGKICLMSPAASSYEYFKNFIEKGNRYKELVMQINNNK